MYYLDTNAFVYPALYSGRKADGAGRLLEDIVDGSAAGATAVLSIDEVVHVLARETARESAIRQGRRLLELPNLRIYDVEDVHTLRALNAMSEHDALSPRDAIHYAAMIEHGVHAIVTDDRDFEAVPAVERHSLESFEST